jgi:hypothetical protein
MRAFAGHRLPIRSFFRDAVRTLGFPTAVMWEHWQTRFWLALLWLLGIPLTTLGFVSMLLWAYGVDQ